MTLSRIIALGMTCALPAAASAESADVQTRIGKGTGQHFFEAMTNDLMIVESNSTFDSFTGVEGTPLEGMKGRCFGNLVILRGVPDGRGNCVFEDASGDKVLQAWTVHEIEPNISHGTWWFIGGTGAHENISGRGIFTSESNPLTGETTNTITGVTTWPEG